DRAGRGGAGPSADGLLCKGCRSLRGQPPPVRQTPYSNLGSIPYSILHLCWETVLRVNDRLFRPNCPGGQKMSKKAWSGRRFVYCAVVVVFATGLLASWPTSEAHGQGLPEAPRLFVDTTYAPPGGRNWCVLVQAPPPGCTSQPDFQTALDNAVPGDVIILQAGTTYTVTGTNPFTLPNRCVPPCNQWIYIQSSAYASLPPPGTRATSAHASFMAKLDGRGSTVLQGGSYVRLIGLEITSATSGAIVDLSGANHVVVDRSWVHGTPSGDVQRGIQANGSWIAVVDSAISNIHHQTNDAQAINAYDGWGPFMI